VYPHLAIHVVENGTRCGSDRVAARFGAAYDFVPVAGLSRARNFAARLATTNLVAFIDDDCVPDPHWLNAAVPEFTDARVGVVTGPVLSIGSQQHWRSLGDRRFIVDRTSPRWFDRANFGGLGHGGNLIMRRSVFESWTGFDERLGRGAPLSGGEDGFALFQLIAEGWRAVYVPNAVVVHDDAAGEALRQEARQTARDSIAYFLFLWAAAPAYRPDIMRYLAEAIVGTKRDWRKYPSPHRLSRLQTWSAWLQGVQAFRKTWFREIA
jgi:GT2 family glycosyltransferase